uniref:Uncharacterized protein n=1 Tax=Amphimedon queenslandica TaxID=400682 RepID=A0A1X7TB54_AMPQE
DVVLTYGLWEEIRVDCGAEFFFNTLHSREVVFPEWLNRHSTFCTNTLNSEVNS